jgi:uncharacterized membrane protein
MNTTPLPTDPDLARFEATRAKNGLRVLIVGFATILLTFLILLYFFASPLVSVKLASTDVIAIFGVVASVVGTLVGTFFGVSAANGARDASASQVSQAADLAKRAIAAKSTVNP